MYGFDIFLKNLYTKRKADALILYKVLRSLNWINQ